MGTWATLVAIKDKKKYRVSVTTDGFVSDTGASFLAMAKYDKEILFNLIKRNAQKAMTMYGFGVIFPRTEDKWADRENAVITQYPLGNGELFVSPEELDSRVRSVYSLLGASAIHYDTLEEKPNIYDYCGEYEKTQRVLEELRRTYILDMDRECISIFGENAGREPSFVVFSELERFNRDSLGRILAEQCEEREEGESYTLLDDIKKGFSNYTDTYKALEDADLDMINFDFAYLHSIKILNHAYTKREVVHALGLDKIYDLVLHQMEYKETAYTASYLDKKVKYRHAPPEIDSRRKAIDFYVKTRVYFYESTKEGEKKRSFKASIGSKAVPITKREFDYAKSKINYIVDLIK